MQKKASGWVKKSPMHRTRSHVAVAVYKDKIFVFGGGGEGFKTLNSTEIYDPASEVWTQGKDMPTTRSGAVAAVVNDRIYVMGGGIKRPDGRFEFFEVVEIYDPESDTWTRGTDMLMPHDYPVSAILNRRIYILGGHHPDATKGGPMTDPGFSFCEVFDTAERTWRDIAPMPTPRFASAAVVMDDRILVLGGAGLRKEGFQNFDIIESYDPIMDKWTDAGFKLPWPAAGLGACVNNNILYIIGGNSGNRIENRFACYNPALNRWMELDPLEEGRIVMGTARIGDTVFLIGGRGPDGKTPLATVESHRLT